MSNAEIRESVSGHSTPMADPMDGLTAASLAAAMGLDTEEVLLCERQGELFSVVRQSQQLRREYPAFQAWPKLVGAPLQRVLDALAGLDPPDLYGFFAGVKDVLFDLTPVEVLMGELVAQRPLEPEAPRLLEDAEEARMQAVLGAAQVLVHLREA